MSLGIVLIHGYSGSSHDLDSLADGLSVHFGKDSVQNISLPGHSAGLIPEFNEDLFNESIIKAVNFYKDEDRKLIIIGHSTGGNLALSAIDRFSVIPELLILVSVPRKIDLSYLERWTSHRTGKDKLPLVDIAMMVQFINKASSKKFSRFPVLIIHGEDDKLVPVAESLAWKKENFPESARIITIPQMDHAVFSGTKSPLVMDLIDRFIRDKLNQDRRYAEILSSLIRVEPSIEDFIKASPSGGYHLALCPGAKRVIERKPELSPAAENDPITANIEITTYCNLKCRYCARSQLKEKNRHMSFEMFCNIFTLLPNTYRIVLVGLGEPLIHPQIFDFIRYAKSLKRKVGLVTNAMLLSSEISSKLLEAGLDTITFSLDGFDEASSSLVRKGTDFEKVITNIKEFVRLSNSTRIISKAVFSAISKKTVLNLKNLIDQVSELGVDVLMVSDINFRSNLKNTLWHNMNADLEKTIRNAVSHAFSKKLPVLSVYGLEEFGLEKRYHDFLLIPPAQLYRRSKTHTWCFSPWQTIPVDVDGNVTLCDCQPNEVIGNLFENPFTEIWNGDKMKSFRAEMLSQNPSESCRICPRF